MQTNKVKEAVALFDVIQTLDRTRLADALAAERDKTRQMPAPVRAGQYRRGAAKGRRACRRETEALIAYARKLELPLDRPDVHSARRDDVAPHFAFLAKLARRMA